MAFTNRNRKRVRIQSGHQERIIERRNPRQRQRVRKQKTRKNPTKRKHPKIQRCGKRSKDEPHWYCKTHQPTVAQVVYSFLERASNQRGTKSQKTNASNQFRQIQRRKRLRPITKKIKPKIEDMEIPDAGYIFPYSKLPSQEAEKSIEKCIYEVLSFGTILGLLIPADREGLTFRVSSEIGLIKKENDTRKPKIPIIKQNSLDDDYCTCRPQYN